MRLVMCSKCVCPTVMCTLVSANYSMPSEWGDFGQNWSRSSWTVFPSATGSVNVEEIFEPTIQWRFNERGEPAVGRLTCQGPPGKFSVK